MSEGSPLGEIEYAELVGRIREAVAGAIPPGASLLVVSKGDAALLEMPGHVSAHFPQDGAGNYAGHHPLDSAAATAELERLRRHGAEYLVIPATARWWLDFYADFARHLANHGEVLADVPDVCLIYGLGRLAASPAGAPAISEPRASVEQTRDYLENLISSESRIVVLDTGDCVAASLAPLKTATLSAPEAEEGDRMLAELRLHAEAGARYFVVPRSSDEWLDRRPELAAEIETCCRKIADQRHLCRVFELEGLREGR